MMPVWLLISHFHRHPRELGAESCQSKQVFVWRREREKKKRVEKISEILKQNYTNDYASTKFDMVILKIFPSKSGRPNTWKSKMVAISQDSHQNDLPKTINPIEIPRLVWLMSYLWYILCHLSRWTSSVIWAKSKMAFVFKMAPQFFFFFLLLLLLLHKNLYT